MCGISLALIAVSSAFDRPIAHWVESQHIRPIMESWHVAIVKAMGVYWVTITVAIVVAFLHRWRIRSGIFVLLIGAIALAGNLMKWLIGRTRPFKLEPDLTQALPFSLEPFKGGLEGLITQKNLAFPSGHTMVAFATAAALAILWPRWRLLFYFLAAAVAAQRVLENDHWLSDVVGAAGLAICGVHLLWRIIAPWVRAEPLARIQAQPTQTLTQA